MGAGAGRRGGATRIVVVGSLIAVAGLGGIGALAMRGESLHAGTATSGAAQATASIDLRSQPAGASIFVDGRPTGLKTPAVLDGLPVGHAVKLRLDLGGYAAASKETTLVAGQPQTLSFTLESAMGTVRLLGAPRQATAELDDRPVDPSKPIAAVGRRSQAAARARTERVALEDHRGPGERRDEAGSHSRSERRMNRPRFEVVSAPASLPAAPRREAGRTPE